ncbi:MAG: MFS transporter [Candidatus Andeanibacterium colombiense]|uniref:MFS transporter n=1 Tax=Candidatus Andeanibacterium colombiense TaxID=3121345 RepID=A0AAJ6BNC0_9SPHN|nr:MAG: MFS transporter [Sphingomonadaceae bacterium]
MEGPTLDNLGDNPVPSTDRAAGWRELGSAHLLPKLLIILLGVWMNAADALVTATIQPSVAADLGGYAAFSWAVAGFLIGSVVAGASSGRVAEIFGLGRAAAFAGVVFAVGCLMSAWAPEIWTFLGGRLVQGIGSGWFSGFGMVAIAQLFPERQIARVFAIIAATWGVATLLGPMVGGLFAEAGNWRAVFWIFLAQAALYAVLAPILFRKAHMESEHNSVPLPQLLAVAVGISMIALADLAEAQVGSLALIFGGFAVMTLVFAIDAKAKVRLLPHRAGDPRTVVGAGYLSIFAAAGASMPFTIYAPPIFQQLKAYSPLQAGYVVASLALTWTVVAMSISHVVSGKEGPWIRRGTALIALAAVAQALTVPTLALAWVIPSGALMGAGFGMSTSLTNRVLLRSLLKEDQAIGSAALMTTRQIGGAVGAALAGVIANMIGFAHGITDVTARGAAGNVFYAAIPMAVLGALGALAMTRKR